MKKNGAIILIVFLFMYTFTPSFAFTKEELKAANLLATKKIIKNHNLNTLDYNLDGQVLRQEIALIATRAMSIKEDSSYKCSGIFGDVSKERGNWVCWSVETLVKNNIITKNTNFRPKAYISKAEALLIIVRATDSTFVLDKNSSWVGQIRNYALENKLVDNYPGFNSLAKRGWVFNVLDKALIKKEKKNKLPVIKVYSSEVIIK